ncbi:TOMM precursor leader peptide-binding protein [Geodermatophilus sp. SYSU D01186]
MAAPDVRLSVSADGRCRLDTGARSVTVEAGGGGTAVLQRLVDDVLPRLRRAAPLEEQLPAPEAAALVPHLAFLRSAGALLFPGDDVAPLLQSAADVRLYAYLCRRSASPDALYRGVRQRPVDLWGPPAVTGPWARLLRDAGLGVGEVRPVEDGAPGSRPRAGALAVVVATCADDRTPDEDPVLRAANRAWCAAGERWVPVLVGPRTIRIGPWTAPGEAACLRCLEVPRQARPAAPRPAGGPPSCAWTSLQPGTLAWAGGVLTQMVLRTAVPVGPHHPWGGLTVVDTERLEQGTTRVWRDPTCPDCGRTGARVQAWQEV